MADAANPLLRPTIGVGPVPGRPQAGALGTSPLEAADRFSREAALWRPALGSPDSIINPAKEVLDARGRDISQNDGVVQGAVDTYKDSIVGSYFRLNAKPAWRTLGFDEEWAREFQTVVEERFMLAAESPACWIDAQGRNTFTELVRLAVGVYVFTGEILATAEWLRDQDRPFATAVQMVSPTRLCNPDGVNDDRWMRRGVERDSRGRPVAYHIRTTYPYSYLDTTLNRWQRVAARKPWGRAQVIHLFEQREPDQSRGVSEMVSVLLRMRMLKRFSELTLQSAVVNAMYAAAIESELPNDVVVAAMGGGASAADGLNNFVGAYLSALNQYVGGANSITADGTKIPHLFPGTKLNFRTVGTPGGVGQDFEASLLRHIAAGLGISYEELSKDYSRTSYISARASLGQTRKHMMARKQFGADRFGGAIYALLLEEWLNDGLLPLPAGVQSRMFYDDPLMMTALTRCTFIGSGAGQIDELKETQSALLRVKAGFSTHEIECGRLGHDYREVYDQLAREKKAREELDLTTDMDAEKPGAGEGQATLQDNRPEEKEPAE